MRRFVLPLIGILLVAGASCAHGDYLLNGHHSTTGYYAYDVAPDKEPFAGDVGSQIHSFADGALIDAKSGDLGASIGYNCKDVPLMRQVFIDLGQVVVLDSLSLQTKCAAWWSIGPVTADFSVEGKRFTHRVTNDGAGSDKIPHDEGLAVNVELPAAGIKARFIRLRLSVPPWRNVQIGELSIIARLPKGEKPLDSMTSNSLESMLKYETTGPEVDKFGQSTREDWPGKICSEAELTKQMKAELAKYPAVKRDPKKFDRFGGDKTLGIKAQATGKWQTQKINGRWWFITPDGNPFLMVAVDGVLVQDWTNSNTAEHPKVPDIGKKFAWLPPKTGKFADCWHEVPLGWWDADTKGIWRFDYFRANLIRAFGEKNYSKYYYQLAKNRIQTWGFNSLGKWGDKALPDMPFIAVVGAASSGGKTVRSYDGLDDPWEPDYVPAVNGVVKHLAAKYKNDPYYIGFTIGNESWWYENVTKEVMKVTNGCAAKKEFIRQLEIKYKDISALNSVCGTDWKSFDDLSTTDLNPYMEKLKPELSAFIELSSRKYYSTWRDAVNKYDPGRLIISSSFVVWWRSCPEWVKGCEPYCDVLMLDEYPNKADHILKEYVEAIAVPADKPVLLGEYSLMTTERGHQRIFGYVPTERERGLTYKSLNEALFAHPNWIGSMWFIYRDEVLMGRNLDGSGESLNCGLVDICNIPYYKMIDVMEQTNKELFLIHAGKKR